MAGKHFDLDRNSNLGGENSSDITIASQKATKTYIDNALQNKQDILTPGSNITISENGVISASLSGQGSALADLSDVNLQETSNGDIIQYNETTNKWENKSLDVPIVPTNVSSFNNDAGYVTETALNEYAKLSETYTKTEINENTVPQTRTINNKALSSDLTLTASDVNALPASTNIPSKTSDLTNDSGFITDISTKQDTETAVKYNGTSAYGSNIKGVFVNEQGEVTECDYSVEKSVPSDADFTNTTYTAGSGLTLNETTFNHNNNVTPGTVGPSDIIEGAVINIPSITYDSEGHITGAETKTHTVSGFLTEHQDISGKANTADLATVATSGSYDDLLDKPTIPSTASDVGAAEEIHTHDDYVPTTRTIAGKPLNANIELTASDVGALSQDTVIPDIAGLAEDSEVVHLTGNETIQGEKTFNNLKLASSPANTDNSTKVATTSFVKSQGYLTSMSMSNISDVNVTEVANNQVLTYDETTQTWVNTSLSIPKDTSDLTNNAGFITEITSTDINEALGYTPYNGATNPNGYLTSLSAGTGISVTGNSITNTGVISIQEGTTQGAIVANINGTDTIINVHGLGTAAYATRNDLADAVHNHSSNTINDLTGLDDNYNSTDPITSTDTLNDALMKLQNNIDYMHGVIMGIEGGGRILVEQLIGDVEPEPDQPNT